MRHIKYICFSLLFCIVFTSCITQRERAARKLSNILDRFPDLYKADTLIKDSIIVVPGAGKDTAFYYISKDTIRIHEKQLTIKYYNKGDTVYLSGNCDSVQYKNIRTTITHTMYKEKDTKLSVWKIATYILTGACIGILIITGILIFLRR